MIKTKIIENKNIVTLFVKQIIIKKKILLKKVVKKMQGTNCVFR